MADSGLLSISSLLMASLASPLDDAANLIFYREIQGYLHDAFDAFGARLFERMMGWAGTISLTLLSFWIALHGYRITTGQSRDSMAVFLTDMTKALVVVSVATGTAFAGGTLYDWVCNLLPNQINRLVADHDGDLYASIDRTFGYMQMGLSSIGDILTADNSLLEAAKTRNQGFVIAGTGMPALVAGTLLLLYQAMLAMVIGFAPLGVLSLLFKRTQSFFWNWLHYLLSVLVAQAVLSVMAAFMLDVVCAVAASFWAGKLLGSNPEGINSLALQQGGLGLIFTVLMISVPAAAAKMFKGLLGEFMPISAFGGGVAAVHSGHSSTSHPQASTHANEGEYPQAPVQMHAHRMTVPVSATTHEDRIKSAEDARSFLERYPNATASLGNQGGRGDPPPADVARDAGASVSAWSPGLGADVDQMIALSPALQRDVQNLRNAMWNFEFGAAGGGSKTIRKDKSILIDEKWETNQKEAFRAFVHEVGHATYPYVANYASRSAYVETALLDEAAAMMKNIEVRREILANTEGRVDIGLNGKAANHEAYDAAYDQYLRDGDANKARRTIATVFGSLETTRSQVDGRNVTYEIYYGEYYAAQRR